MDSSFSELPHSTPADQTREHAADSDAKTHGSLFQQVMEHSKTTWRNVVHAKATPSQYLEAGAEAVATGIALRYGLTRFSIPETERLLKAAETPVVAPGIECSAGGNNSLLFKDLVQRGDTREAAIDRLAPVLTRRTLRYVIDSNFPRE